MEILADYGILGLFVSAFLAATILPLSSEVLLGVLLAQGMNPGTVLFAATTGNVLGSVTNYLLGYWGSRLVLNRVMGMSDSQVEKSVGRFRRYGVFSLLFAWVPVVGDPLTVAAGVMKIRFCLFLLLVGTGKFLRYVAVMLALKSLSIP